MLDAIYISAIGLQAQKEQLTASAGNFANIGTTAYKRQSVDFSAILDRAPEGHAANAMGTVDVHPRSVQQVDLTQGALRATGRALDLAISGPGFIEVDVPGGGVGYSRGGSLIVNAEGGLSLPNGLPLKADIRVPAGVADVQVQADGSVVATPAAGGKSSVVGQIEVATFVNPEQLQYRGEGLFAAPEGMADPVRTKPGEEGTSQIVPGNLETANVSMEDEMVALMLMQRVYELNSRLVQTADELMSMSNNLRHGG